MTTVERSRTEEQTGVRDALVGRIFAAALGSMDLLTVYIGDRLGLYEALSRGAAAPAELAARTGTNERYAREWLEQQAVSGILNVDDPRAESGARRYSLPDGHAEVLLDEESMSYLAPVARLVASTAAVLPELLDAFRYGGGVSWEAYGADAREAQASMNRPAFLTLLGEVWLPAIANVHTRLQASPPARVADIGCGAGWSAIAMARAYAGVAVDGFDVDAPSIELARTNAAAAGLDNRVRFHLRDAADPTLEGAYDLVTAFECIHDLPRPVEALRTMRRLAGSDGVVIVMDERVAERFTVPGDEMERFFYGASVLCCLPTGMASQPSAATGTMMRPDTLRRYAAEAGFREVEIVPLEHPFFRFYRLRQ